jgi:hypothetical protein
VSAKPKKPQSAADPICDLIRKAQAGDETALSRIRKLLDDPATRQSFADLAAQIRASLIERFAGDDCLVREVVEREVRDLRAELLGPDPTPAERLLAERVAIGWLEVHTAEQQLARQSLDDAPFWQRQVDHAQRRFLAALRTLAALRRLPRPAAAVNGGGRAATAGG